ncbi:MAG: hypothetical protein JWM57_2659 [Phycisphaerales bacterium]|nr:hypothetical protein [Phycisphaerales bacterium]
MTGSLQFNGVGPNFYDKANGLVPASGYLNSPVGPTVVVAEPAIEFGYNDTTNLINTNVTDSQVLLTDQYLTSATVLPYTVKLTDPAFSGLGVTLIAETFAGTPTAGISGTTLTITIPGVTGPAVNTLALAFFSVQTPEPTSLAAVASVGLIALRRRRA